MYISLTVKKRVGPVAVTALSCSKGESSAHKSYFLSKTSFVIGSVEEKLRVGGHLISCILLITLKTNIRLF